MKIIIILNDLRFTGKFSKSALKIHREKVKGKWLHHVFMQ
jgi:hypothetical protein